MADEVNSLTNQKRVHVLKGGSMEDFKRQPVGGVIGPLTADPAQSAPSAEEFLTSQGFPLLSTVVGLTKAVEAYAALRTAQQDQVAAYWEDKHEALRLKLETANANHKVMADALAAYEAATIERCAQIADNADKSIHPSRNRGGYTVYGDGF